MKQDMHLPGQMCGKYMRSSRRLLTKLKYPMNILRESHETF